MKRSETALVLAKIAAIDNRRLDPPDANLNDPMSTPILNAWHELIGDFGLADCLAAVQEHRASSTEWLQPAHVITRVKAIREQRLANGPSLTALMDDVDPHDPRWRSILVARQKAIADGLRPNLKAITA